MTSKTFRRIAATTVVLTSILSASAAFAENGNWPNKGPANLYLPGASTQLDTGRSSLAAQPATPAPRDTGSAPQATASAAPAGTDTASTIVVPSSQTK